MRRMLLFLVLFSITVFAVSGKETVLKELVNPNAVLVDGKQIYITESTSIYIYDLETLQLKAKFGKRGEGPGELMGDPNTGVAPLLIDVKTEDIFINSFNRISYYSKDGKFKKETRYGGNTQTYLPIGKNFLGRRMKQEDGKLYWRLSIYGPDFKEITNLARALSNYQGKGVGYRIYAESKAHSIYDNKIY
ncbi:MAG: hypothetical protein GY940_47470, partial [bacterium]|nr:hypothetical protein [bacterium]